MIDKVEFLQCIGFYRLTIKHGLVLRKLALVRLLNITLERLDLFIYSKLVLPFQEVFKQCFIHCLIGFICFVSNAIKDTTMIF